MVVPVVFEHSYAWGRAYRDGKLVCGRVHVTVGRDARLGLAPNERRYITARFRERLDAALHAELAQLVRRRGAAARRIAETYMRSSSPCANWARRERHAAAAPLA